MKIFDTRGRDRELKVRDGQECVVVRALTEQEADLSETGPMYRVRFCDGFEADAFEDEIAKAEGRA